MYITSLRDLEGGWKFYFYKYTAPLGQERCIKSRSDEIFVEKQNRILISPRGAKYKECKDVCIAMLYKECLFRCAGGRGGLMLLFVLNGVCVWNYFLSMGICIHFGEFGSEIKNDGRIIDPGKD